MPDELMPDWLAHLLTLALGAGGARMLAVWMENRRLSKQSYRETLMERIKELEDNQAAFYTRISNLRVTVATLESENRQLRGELNDLKTRADDADHADRPEGK